MKTEMLAKKIDTTKVESIRKKVETNGIIIDEIVNSLVTEYCGPLDDYMLFIKDLLDSDNPPSALELDDITMNLPILIYFVSEAQETLGIKEDVANAIRMEQYNQSFSNQDGTIPAKEAAASLEVQHEYISHMAYSRAYKKISARIKAAYEMISSVKKVVSRRMQERDIVSADANKFRKGV